MIKVEEISNLTTALTKASAEIDVSSSEEERLSQALTASEKEKERVMKVVEQLTLTIESQGHTIDVLQAKLSEEEQELRLAKDETARSEEKSWIKELETKIKRMTKEVQEHASHKKELLDDASEWEKRESSWDKEKKRLLRANERLILDAKELRRELDRQVKTAAATEQTFHAEAERVEAELGKLGEDGIMYAADVSSAVQVAAKAVSSGDVEAIAQELVHQTERYELLRAAYASSMANVQAARGNILVCCRVRPISDGELGAGHRPCIDATDDREPQGQKAAWREFSLTVSGAQKLRKRSLRDIEPLADVPATDITRVVVYGWRQRENPHCDWKISVRQHGVTYRTLRKLFESQAPADSSAEEAPPRRSRSAVMACRKAVRVTISCSWFEVLVEEAAADKDQEGRMETTRCLWGSLMAKARSQGQGLTRTAPMMAAGDS